MPGDSIDPFEIKGNLSVIASVDVNEFGDGSIDVDGNINLDGHIGENTLGNGININDLKLLTFKEQGIPLNPSINEHKFYFDSLLKSLDNSGVLTTYQPTTTKGDILTHNGTTQIRLPVGVDTYVLTADSTEASGLKWAAGGGGGSGESNTASNVGITGIGVFKQKTGINLEFKNINTGSSKVSVSDDTGNNEIDIDIVEGNIVHQNLSGSGTNTHAQIDSHISNTSNPHSVSIDQITPTTTKGDLLVENGTNVVRLPAGTDTYILKSNSAESSGLQWTAFDHGSMDGLADDDHSQYLHLPGRSSGQTAIGSTSASGNLILQSTTNATKGQIIIDETTGSTSITTGALRVDGGAGIAENLYIGGLLGIDTINENTSASGVTVEGTVFKDSHYTINEINEPGNPIVSSDNVFYIDTFDSLLKSKDSSGTITTYQPTKNKGDLLSHTGVTQTRIPIGLSNQVLTVDSSQPSGVKWENFSSGTGGTGTDPDSNKYLNIYSSGTQILTNSYQDILFDTDRRTDDFYNHNLSSQENITILQPAIYFVYFRCTTFTDSGNNNSSSSVRMVLDSGGGFNEVDGTKSFMFNRDSSQGCNTCCFSIIKSFSANDIIKLQVKQDSGTSTLQTLQSATEIMIIRMQVDQSANTTQYLSVYNENTQNLNTSYSDIVFNTERLKDNIFNYSTSTGILNFSESGIYYITCNISTSTNSNTETQTHFRLLADSGGGFTEIPGSRGYMHNDDSPDSTNTGFVSFVYNATIGDNIKVQGIIDAGAPLASTIADGCNFNIVKLNSTLGQSSVKYFDSYNDTGGTIINTNYTDIPLIGENIKDSIYTHSASSAEITISEDGRYCVFARVCYNKSSGTTETLVKTRIVVNSNASYFELSGTQSCSYHSNTTTGYQQTFIGATIQLAANSKLKLQGIIEDGNNTEVANYGTGLTIFRLEPLNVGQAGLVIFGSELGYVESSSTTSSNSVAYIQKLRLTTDNVPSGTYRIGFYYIWTINNTNQDFLSRVQIDDSLTVHETTGSIQRSNQDIATSGLVHVALSLGVHTIDLDFKTVSTNTTASIKDARLEFWRLS